MTTWDNIWSFRTARFVVDCDVTEDWDTDLSWDDDGSVRQGLQDGNLVSFQARVRVLLDDGKEVGCDYLGGCIYKSFAEFVEHGVKGSYFPDMVREAVSNARCTLLKLQSVHVRGGELC